METEAWYAVADDEPDENGYIVCRTYSWASRTPIWSQEQASEQTKLYETRLRTETEADDGDV